MGSRSKSRQRTASKPRAPRRRSKKRSKSRSSKRKASRRRSKSRSKSQKKAKKAKKPKRITRKSQTGSKRQVWNGTRMYTSGGLTKKDLKMSKNGKIVYKSRSAKAGKNFKNSG